MMDEVTGMAKQDMAGWGPAPDGTWVLLGLREDGVRPYVAPQPDGSVKVTLDSNGPLLECTLTAEQWAAMCSIPVERKAAKRGGA